MTTAERAVDVPSPPPRMAIIIAFFAGHWLSSVFCQTFFLHRY
jgi:hypothetical protein